MAPGLFETTRAIATIGETNDYSRQSQSLNYSQNPYAGNLMTRKERPAVLPREVITLTSYAMLNLYLAKFAARELGLVLLIGRHGTGKTESVRRALKTSIEVRPGDPPDQSYALCVEGHAQPFGLYVNLWEHRHKPVVLDDLDKLYANPNCVRLLKPLCNTEHTKRISWLSHLTLNASHVPTSFCTTSNVILIANEWRTVNPNVRALEDRAIILHFDPSNREIHRHVGEWFHDQEVYEFIQERLDLIAQLSIRHYSKGSQLRRAGFGDWHSSLLQMTIPDNRMACVVRLQQDPALLREEERVIRFIKLTGQSRATYFRLKARFAAMAIQKQ